jgi:hypothetical protein
MPCKMDTSKKFIVTTEILVFDFELFIGVGMNDPQNGLFEDVLSVVCMCVWTTILLH